MSLSWAPTRDRPKPSRSGREGFGPVSGTGEWMVKRGALGQPDSDACSTELAVTVASANRLNPFFPRVRRHEDDRVQADM